MTTTLRDLQEKRAQTWERMKEIRDKADENGLLAAEDEAAWDAAETELERFSKQIEREERAAGYGDIDTVDRTEVESPLTPEQQEATAADTYREAFDLFVRNGISDVSPEQRQVLRGGFVSGKELRAQGVGVATAGGYLAPEGWRDTIVEAIDSIANMAAISDVLTTTSGETINWPTEDDTANEGAILAENTQVTEQDMEWGTASVDAYMYTSKLVRVSIQLLQDNSYDAENRLGRALGRRIGRVQNRHFTVGTGTAQPEGVVTGAVVGKTGAAGQLTTIEFDDLIDLEMSVNEVYRNNGRFLLSDSALTALRKEKDGNGAYIWQPSTQAGVPSLLNGRPYTINNSVPDPAASAKSVLFGDFREGYLIRRVRDVQLLRLAERYADFLQVGFLAFHRADGTPQNTAAYRAFQHAAA